MAKILIADDSHEIRTLYGAALRQRGHDVHEAADGRQAIEAVLQLQPDLLILDVWMPLANGFEVLDALASETVSSRLRVVMLSILDDGDSQLYAFGGGAVEYLVKGVSLQTLIDRVEAILATPPAHADVLELDPDPESEADAEPDANPDPDPENPGSPAGPNRI